MSATQPQPHLTEPRSTSQLDEIFEPPSLELRITDAIAQLAHQREISWAEAALVLDAVRLYDEAAARRERIVHRLLGGEGEPR